MTSAMRRVVHSSVEKPAAIGPANRCLTSMVFWREDNLGGLPGVGLETNPCAPFFLYCWRHRNTELTEEPTFWATADKDSPCLSSSMARRRRRSSCFGLPGGLMPPEYHKTKYISIIYT